MTEFTICSSIEYVRPLPKLIGARFDTYVFEDNNVCLSDQIYRQVSYANCKSVSELIVAMDEPVKNTHVTFSDHVLEVLRGLFAKEYPEREPKPSLTITSYLVDSQSFEFTTDRGVFRVKEKLHKENAYRELILLLNDAGIDTSWIVFERQPEIKP